jgi:hypothetical protein
MAGLPHVLVFTCGVSGEVDAGSYEENASKQKDRALVLIQSEPKRL